MWRSEWYPQAATFGGAFVLFEFAQYRPLVYLEENLGSSWPAWPTSTTEGVPTTVWRKSSYSGNINSNCVEVALTDTSAAVRDSKNPTGPHLHFPAQSWQLLTTAAHRDAAML